MQKPVLLMIWKWDGWILCDCSPCCIALRDWRLKDANNLFKNVPGEVWIWDLHFSVRYLYEETAGVWGCGGWSGWALFHRLPAIICPQPTTNVPFFSLASQSSPLKPSTTLKKEKRLKLLSNSLCICCVILCRTENSVTKKDCMNVRARVNAFVSKNVTCVCWFSRIRAWPCLLEGRTL